MQRERDQVDYSISRARFGGQGIQLFHVHIRYAGNGKDSYYTRGYQEDNKRKKTPLFDFIHINAMSLTNPNLVYTILADRVIDKKMSPSSAALFLEEFFKAKEADKDRIV